MASAIPQFKAVKTSRYIRRYENFCGHEYIYIYIYINWLIAKSSKGFERRIYYKTGSISRVCDDCCSSYSGGGEKDLVL